MKHFVLSSAITLLTAVNSISQGTRATDQVIIKYKHETAQARSVISGVNEKFSGTLVKKIALGKRSGAFVYVIKFPSVVDVAAVVNEYNNTGMVEYAEPDHIGSGTGNGSQTPLTNDQYYFRQWSLKNNGTFSLSPAVAGADIDMENGWTLEQGDTNITVTIIDSGSKMDHPEFTGRIWKNYAEIPNNATDDDANGYVDDVQGWDFANSDNNPTDDHGHGTNVMGIIGANANNSIGYAGVDWKCKLMVLKGLDNAGSGYYSWWADAIYYAVDNGARVINMSLAGTSTSATLQSAVTFATNNNVVVVAAIGNANSNVLNYPSAFPGAIAVGSTDANDHRSNPFFWSTTSGSSFGSHISVVAPGNYMYGLDYQSNTNYNSYWGGTSQAAPLAAGVAALLLAQDPSRTPAQIKSILETTAEDQVGLPSEDVAGFDQYYGHGRLNAFQALSVFTGVNDLNASISYDVFPNPSNGILHVILDREPAEKTLLVLSNLIGQEILKMEITSQTTKVNVPGLKGLYLLSIEQEKGIRTKKIVFN